MTEQLHYILFGIICFFPFMLFAYYPLRYFKRFSTKVTFLLEILLAIPEVILFIITFKYFSNLYFISAIIIVIFNILLYMLLYKISIERILFNLLLIVNIANFTVTFAKLLAIILFPKSIALNFHWENAVCVLITEIIFVLPTFFYIKHYSDSMIRNNDYNYIWHIAWLIPMLLSALGFMLIYGSSIYAETLLALYVKKSLLCAIVMISMLLSYSFIAKLIRTQHNVLKLKQDLYLHSIQKIQIEKIQQQIQDTRILRHDLRHHIRLMCTYVDHKDYDKLKEYLHHYSDSIQDISQLHYTNNAVVNTLLVYYAELSRSSDIEFNVNAALPDTLPLQDNEITILFSNLLENAYHACCEMDSSLHRFIHVHSTSKSDAYLLISIDNSFINNIKQDSSGNFLTTKADGNGLGLLSVQEIVSKYNGHIKNDTINSTFSISIYIPLT